MPNQEESPVLLTKRQAVELLGLDVKTFDNYFKNAGEFSAEPRPNNRGFFKFDKAKLLTWQQNFNWRTVNLDKEEYAQCLDFALAIHFKEYVTSDFGTGRQREFGQKVTNWVKGQLGEIAVRKFFKQEFDTDIELDFEIRDAYVPQDVVGVKENGVIREPKIGIGIKSSKPKSAFLVLGSNEIGRDQRVSDVYIYCRPDLPDDHLLRISKEAVMALVKGQYHYDRYKDLIPEFSEIPCEIAGWCLLEELNEVTEIPGQTFDGTRFVIQSGKMRKSKEDWQNLINRL